MMTLSRALSPRVLAATVFLAAAAALFAQPAHHVFFRVQADQALPGPVSGRLLIFLKQGTGDKEVDSGEFSPQATYIAAEEIRDLAPGASVELDADQLAFPAPFNTLVAGDYEAQVVLDVDHAYNYGGRDENAWLSKVLYLPAWTPGMGDEPVLMLTAHPEAGPMAARVAQAKAAATPDVARLEDIESPLLTRFWGRSTHIRAWVILPPGYEKSKEKYPTVYWTHGFGGKLDYALVSGLNQRKLMDAGKTPPMIWVMLDESVPQGTHEFADSVNNGPWGAALTTEFIPELEKRYRMDAKATGRFLNGHSSGGWATLQLQVNYPNVFGGTWSTSPDPSDFHDFTGVDLYADNANVYHRADGSKYPIFRDKGKVVSTYQDFALQEEVLGAYGGQMASFEWVFSPKGADGAPMPMFDRKTGAVDAKVVAYWHDHYDLANIVETHWAERGAMLKGRIHLIVGDADSFYLDGAAHKFEARLTRLGAEPHFAYLPGKTHFDLYAEGDNRSALFEKIAAEMYAVARPGAGWKKAQ